MYRAAFALAATLVLAASARAQVVYLPVQHQHVANGLTYYYAGNDPGMLHYIEHVKCRNGYPNAITGNHYTGLHQTLGQIGEPVYIFTDCMRYTNAAVYGYTEVDVRNEAYASVPVYFTMRSQLESAVPCATGGMVVPANGRPHDVLMHAEGGATTKPSADVKPKAIIILPKRLPKQQQPEGQKQVAAATN